MRIIRVFVTVIIMMFSAASAYAGGDTALTYQGRLLDAGEPANGTFNLGFSLWDAAINGNQVGTTQMLYYTPVSDGLFTVQIDFGADAFNNNDRWLEISVDGTTLDPRQPITRSPYSIQTRGIIVNDDQHVGMGISPSSARLRVWNFAGNGFEVLSSSRAVEAISTGDMAVLASNQSADGMGVFAQHQPSGNQGWLGTPDYGVYGLASDIANDWAGYFLGRGYFSGNVGIGTTEPIAPLEVHNGNTGQILHLVSDQSYGYIRFNEGSMNRAVLGFGDAGDLLVNALPDSFAINGMSSALHFAVDGDANRGITIDTNGNVGIGTTFPEYTLEVTSSGERTISAYNTANSTFTYGVYTICNSIYGIGVSGWVDAISGFTYGVLGRTSSPGGFGVYSLGDSGATGTKYFIQPHPYDPSKEIRFVCLEGNESGTYFRGSTQLVDGRAIIDVPEEFRLVSDTEGLTVQVTAKGPNAGLWVEYETLDRIVVRGNGNVKFNYFVNGIRRGFADMELIRENHGYVPEVRGVPFGTQYRDGQRQILVENGILNPDFTPNEATAAMMGWTLRDPEPDELSRAASNTTGESK